MLKILTLAAIIGFFAFALSFAGFSAWRSFYQQNQQTNHETGSKKPTENSSNSPLTVATEEKAEDAIARYNLWLMIFTGVLAFVALIQIGFLISADLTAARSRRGVGWK
jgi:hypothetical protein